jgi:predicted MFS family arabinose efflux permease
VYVVLGAAIGFGGTQTLVGFAPTLTVALVLLVPAGFFMVSFAQATNQRLQLSIDPAYRGRVMALFVLVLMGTTPIGAPIVGLLSEAYGPRSVLWGGGLASLAAGLTVLGLELRRSGARIGLRLRPLPAFYVIAPTDAVALTRPELA